MGFCLSSHHSWIKIPAFVSPPSTTAQFLEPSGEPAWLSRCRVGDRAAWRSLYDEHIDFVWRIARRLGTPEADLPDVCQEAFQVAFRKLGDFRGGRFSTWIYRITANLVSDRNRRRRFRDTLAALLGAQGEERTVPGPDAALRAQEDAALVERALERMAAKKREVFVLYEIEGLSGREIATMVGCGIKTVWSRLEAARKEYQQIMKRMEAGQR